MLSEEFMDRLIPKHPLWFVWAGGSIMSLWLFFWWSIGLFPSDAFGSGFARAEDVKSVQTTLLEASILEARIRYCTAPVGTPSKQFFLRVVNEKMKDYNTLTTTVYPLPLCEELVVANNI